MRPSAPASAGFATIDAMKIARLICIAIVCTTSRASAQAVNLDSGRTVRVTASAYGGNRIVATLISANNDSLVFVPLGTDIRVAYKMADV